MTIMDAVWVIVAVIVFYDAVCFLLEVYAHCQQNKDIEKQSAEIKRRKMKESLHRQILHQRRRDIEKQRPYVTPWWFKYAIRNPGNVTNV